MRRLGRNIAAFLFAPTSDRWLSILRVGIGLQVSLYCLSLRADWMEFFSVQSIGSVKRDLAEAILSGDSSFIPHLGWLVEAGAHVGLSESRVVSFVWWLLLFSSLFLIAGLFSRSAAVLTAFLHLCAVKSTGSLSYGFDNFSTIGLFYLAIGPLPDRLTLDHWWRGRSLKDPELLGFFRRVLQIHLCVIYFFGGLTKCAGPGWWDGTNLWRAMIRPPFNMISPDLLVGARHFFPVAGAAICLLEIAYPVFIWPRKTRRFWLFAVLAMHAGIGLALGLYLFALVMIVLNLAAFGLPLKEDPVEAGEGGD